MDATAWPGVGDGLRVVYFGGQWASVWPYKLRNPTEWYKKSLIPYVTKLLNEPFSTHICSYKLNYIDF